MFPLLEVNKVSKKYNYGKSVPYYTLRDTLENIISLSKRSVPKSGDGGEFWALKDVSFKVNEGEILGIIGANGAGKSTLLKILSRITPPTKGEIVLRGRVGSLLEVGTGFHPELSGRENIFLNGTILGMSRKEISKKMEEIIDFAEIEKFIDTPVKRYSSGMYVRLAFSVASQLEPEILLVDEVLSVGDIVFQKKSLGKIQSIANSGRTVIFVSHSMGTIKNICQRVILLGKGKLLADGSPDKVISKYTDLSNDQNIGPKAVYDLKPNLEAQHLSITLVNSKMKPTTVFKLGEAGYAIVEYLVRKTLKSADVAVMISQAASPLWIGLDTDANPQLLLGRKKGKFKQIIELPVHVLMPGNYHLGPSMGYAGIGPIDRQYYNGVNFEIINVPSDPRHRVQRKEKGGLICYIKDWKDCE